MKKSIKRLLCLLLAFTFVAGGFVLPLSAETGIMPGVNTGNRRRESVGRHLRKDGVERLNRKTV